MSGERKAGWFFRNCSVDEAKRRINGSDASDFSTLDAALTAELSVRRPRKRLVAALRKRITKIEQLTVKQSEESEL